MSRFVQLHILTPYHPSNLNRDDLNRPKTAYMGEALRLRVSSQSLKRAWRTSELFQQSFSGSLGVRTKELGKGIYDELLAGGVAEKAALRPGRWTPSSWKRTPSRKPCPGRPGGCLPAWNPPRGLIVIRAWQT